MRVSAIWEHLPYQGTLYLSLNLHLYLQRGVHDVRRPEDKQRCGHVVRLDRVKHLTRMREGTI